MAHVIRNETVIIAGKAYRWGKDCTCVVEIDVSDVSVPGDSTRRTVLLACDGYSISAIHRAALAGDEATWRAVIEVLDAGARSHDHVIHAYEDAPPRKHGERAPVPEYRPHLRPYGRYEYHNAWMGYPGWRADPDWRARST